jgi:ribosomal protein S18 acetylase RimI-like enzyme
MAMTPMSDETKPAQPGDVYSRLATTDESVAISSVLHEAFKDYRPLYTPGGFAATALSPEQVQARIAEGPVWVMIRHDEIVGTAAATLKRPDLYIRGMAVVPTARGLRIGESLLREIETLAVRNGCRRLFLSTTPFLDRAIRLYEKFGFERTQEGPHDLFGTPLFTMQKTLVRRD